MATTRMTQTALVRALAEKAEITNKQARAVLDNLSAVAVSEVKKNGVFVLPGIGRLVRVERKARMGRNPATGAAPAWIAVGSWGSRKQQALVSLESR